MKAPEGEINDPEEKAEDQNLPLEEIKKRKPVVKSSSEDDRPDQDPESDKPDLPPAMPPMM